MDGEFFKFSVKIKIFIYVNFSILFILNIDVNKKERNISRKRYLLDPIRFT
jgi:hypothetical protein